MDQYQNERKKENSKKRSRRYRVRKRMMKNNENKVLSCMKIKTNQHMLPKNDEFGETSNASHHGDFEDNLKNWAVKHNITQRALNDLLSILIVFGFHFLPKDCRTLMKTPQQLVYHQLSKGKLWYRSVTDCLQKIFQNLESNISIRLDFNFDGVPLFESSNSTFWPIVVSIRGNK